MRLQLTIQAERLSFYYTGTEYATSTTVPHMNGYILR